MPNNAFEVTEMDVENVLRSNSLAVANTNGKSFESIANEVFGNLDFDLIEQAALYGDDLDDQRTMRTMRLLASSVKWGFWSL